MQPAASGGTSTIETSGSGDFYNLTITNNTTVQATSSIGINNNLTINSGSTFDRMDETIDVNGNVTINGTYDDSDATGSTTVAGDWTDNGTFTIGTQTVTFDGSGNATISASGTGDFYNLTVNKTGSGVALTGTSINATNDVTVSGGELEVGDAFTLQVGNDVSVTGTLVFCN